MIRRENNLSVLIGLGLSVSIHLLIMLPVFLAALNADPRVSYLEARFDPEDFTPEPDEEELEEEESLLGLDVDTPSTLTWVGYEEYQEHIAALAQMDQAAFVDEVQAPRRTQLPPTETSTLNEERPARTTESPDSTPSNDEPPVIDPDQMIAFQSLMDALSRLFGDQGEANPRPENSETPAQKKEKKNQEESKPAEPREPTPPSTEAPPVTPTPGDKADKESDPTSVVDAKPENWKLGKPLAASGLELKPRRPVFTTLQTLTSAPENPLCRLHFGSDGVPKQVEILESSGNSEVDSVITSSLYRWRAKGKSLATLKKNETRKVTIRIVLRSGG